MERVRTRKEETLSLLKRFKEGYRPLSELASIRPDFKEKVKEVLNLEDVPRLPKGIIYKPKRGVRAQVIKWYSIRDGQLDSYYDDGSPLPEDLSQLLLITRTVSEFSETVTVVQTDTWILKTKLRGD